MQCTVSLPELNLSKPQSEMVLGHWLWRGIPVYVQNKCICVGSLHNNSTFYLGATTQQFIYR